MLSKLLSTQFFLFRLPISCCFLAILSSCSVNSAAVNSAAGPKHTVDSSLGAANSSVSSNTTTTESISKRSVVTSNTSRPSLVAINSLGIATIKPSSAKVAKSVGNFDLSNVVDELQIAFRSATNTEVIALNDLRGATKEAISGDIDSQLALAKKNKLDGLLITELQSFSDRSGSALGTNQGSEFGVVLKVIEVGSGKLAWEGSYYEQSSSGPLISVTGGELRKPEFRSLDSLIKEGFAKLGADFASARLKTYLAK